MKLLGRGSGRLPKPIEENEIIYMIRKENGMTASQVSNRLNVYFYRIQKILQRMCKEGKLEKMVLGKNVYYKVRDE